MRTAYIHMPVPAWVPPSDSVRFPLRAGGGFPASHARLRPPPSCPDLFRASISAAAMAPMEMPGTSPGMTGRGMTGRGPGRRSGSVSGGGETARNVMFCHAGLFPPGCRRGPPLGLRRGSVSVMRASFQASGGTGVSLFRASSRGRARGAAGGRIAAARLARLIARARRQTHLARPFPPGCFSRPPAGRFLQKSRKAAPEAASLYFHSTPYRQMSSPSGNKK